MSFNNKEKMIHDIIFNEFKTNLYDIDINEYTDNNDIKPFLGDMRNILKKSKINIISEKMCFSKNSKRWKLKLKYNV